MTVLVLMTHFPGQNLLRREPLKLVDGGESQRTFVYIKDAIEAVLLMIVCTNTLLHLFLTSPHPLPHLHIWPAA